MELQTTLKYEKFKTIHSNRPVNAAHVRALKSKIQKKNLLHLNPIIINHNWEVVDGQHRLQAAKELKLPVFFIMDDVVGEADIADLNTTKKNWSTDEYIEFWSKKGNENYIKLKKFIKQYPGLQKSAAYRFLDRVNLRDLTIAIKEGNFKYTGEKELLDLISKADDFKELKYKHSRDFLSALSWVIGTGVYDHAIMMAKLDRQPGKLIFCSNQQQYVELLEKIYNYQTSLNIVTFKLSADQRARLAAKERTKMKQELQSEGVLPKSGLKKETKTAINEKKFAANFLKEEKLKPELAGKKIRVQLDKKTWIEVKPGTDIAALKKKYQATHQIHEEA